ncbi:unnamed protein product [Cuscuta campestris]|uniref:RING-type E3 ubiquitin transferase n=1 Tax=Cuscuta campestris TaxID=132261 RepID=A0A484NAE2_9ASTE|nr:unnamed protein product [Cuscuta campestris]
MAAKYGSGLGSRIRIYYETRVFTQEKVDGGGGSSLNAAAAAAPIAAASAPGTPPSSSIVFKVHCIMRLSVAAGDPTREFLEVKDWRDTRHSSIDLPCSTDGLFIDDTNHNQIISEALTVLRVLKESHKSIIDQLRQGAASLGLAPIFMVEICEVTHATLPVIREDGKRFIEQCEEDDEIVDQDEVVPFPDNNEEENKKEPDDAECLNALKRLILDVGDINEEDEVAIVDDWTKKFMDIVYRVTDEEEKAAKEEKEAKDEEEERTCPICMNIFEPDEKRSKMICCPQVFHCDCISTWLKRGKTCPWWRSSLPLVLPSAKGIIKRNESEYFVCPVHPGVSPYLVERSVWSKEILHALGCECGCLSRVPDVIVV